MLAGNIVQVRPERKALSAAVGPTCCSGREQRSKTAFAGSAIPLSMKAALLKQLRVQRRALREPDHRHRSLAAAKAVARLRFFPLIGVDAKGRRLGMGGGYYDRALAFRARRRCWKGPHLVGLAFDCQRTNVKFADAWDIRLDSLATESAMEHFL